MLIIDNKPHSAEAMWNEKLRRVKKPSSLSKNKALLHLFKFFFLSIFTSNFKDTEKSTDDT